MVRNNLTLAVPYRIAFAGTMGIKQKSLGVKHRDSSLPDPPVLTTAPIVIPRPVSICNEFENFSQGQTTTQY